MILLDTHVLWWLDQEVPSMGTQARGAADDALTNEALLVSAITFCEIAALVRRGRLALPEAITDWRRALPWQGLIEHPVDGGVAMRAAELDALHRDPGDRLIIASALELGATLVTADGRLLDWAGPLSRLDARR